MNEAAESPTTHAARSAVAQAVSGEQNVKRHVEYACVGVLVNLLNRAIERQQMTRVVQDVVEGALSAAGVHRRDVIYGAVRGAILGGEQIGMDPAFAAMVAVSTVEIGQLNGASDPNDTDAALRGAMSAADQIMMPIGGQLYEWLDERISIASPYASQPTEWANQLNG